MTNKSMFFIAASGILMAILFVWAQLWTTTAEVYRSYGATLLTAGYGLSYVYYAILASVVAFIITIFKLSVCRWALVSMTFALILTLGQVIATTVSTVTKSLLSLDLLAPLTSYADHFSSFLAHLLILFGIPLVLFVLCYLVVMVIPKTKRVFDHLVG